ncbi:amino acid permease [Trypanosoma rangeli]|uniref:Amino acid permease n=1 Tax=Trypanosoma rangeli TaxID=5698 RepID=A0A3R7P1R0_TRYRA|nr:amino acid permease [Trypanosoma rangeli]RNF11330.1 amino acid permease [Trypanosoma rangeli]|eukprot:RNF11330.1 amino acid permease [Trypanosoma rangeli]
MHGNWHHGALFFYRKRGTGVLQDAPLLSVGRSESGFPKKERDIEEATNFNEDDFEIPGVRQPTLGQLRATAIAGNDITSSCLYTTGIIVSMPGRFSCFASVFVSIILYLSCGIYAEVFGALPMNGGTYNAVLNTIDKNWAAQSATLSTLSYIETTVTSAASAGDYLQFKWNAIPSKWVSMGIFGVFAMMTLLGVKESFYAATGVVFFVFFCFIWRRF